MTTKTLRPRHAFWTLFGCLTLLVLGGVSTASAQLNGGFEWKVIANPGPGGTNNHVATVWVMPNGESIWRAENKMNASDLSKGLILESNGEIDPPSGMYPDYTSTTLTSSQSFSAVHVYKRPSDNVAEYAIVLDLGCVDVCFLTDLEFIITDDAADDLNDPAFSTYAFHYNSSWTAQADDVVEDHEVQ